MLILYFKLDALLFYFCVYNVHLHSDQPLAITSCKCGCTRQLNTHMQHQWVRTYIILMQYFADK